jgi:hypothetical protein
LERLRPQLSAVQTGSVALNRSKLHRAPAVPASTRLRTARGAWYRPREGTWYAVEQPITPPPTTEPAGPGAAGLLAAKRPACLYKRAMRTRSPAGNGKRCGRAIALPRAGSDRWRRRRCRPPWAAARPLAARSRRRRRCALAARRSTAAGRRGGRGGRPVPRLAGARHAPGVPGASACGRRFGAINVRGRRQPAQ